MLVVIFDLDDTLSESKLPIDKEISSLLTALMSRYVVVILSGCKYEQFEAQVIPYLEPMAKNENLILFPVNATQLYRLSPEPVKVYEIKLDDVLKAKIAAALKVASMGIDVPWGDSYGEIIEDRGSQITFSALGQEAPLELKSQWDANCKKRLIMQKRLLRLLPECDITVGGKTSIDINAKGQDKSYAICRLEDMGYKKSDMLFVGDALFEGGNDYPIKQAGVVCIEVKGHEDTKRVIAKILGDKL